MITSATPVKQWNGWTGRMVTIHTTEPEWTGMRGLLKEINIYGAILCMEGKLPALFPWHHITSIWLDEAIP